MQLYFFRAAPAQGVSHMGRRLICAFQEIMSQAKKAKAAETVTAPFISVVFSVGTSVPLSIDELTR